MHACCDDSLATPVALLIMCTGHQAVIFLSPEFSKYRKIKSFADMFELQEKPSESTLVSP